MNKNVLALGLYFCLAILFVSSCNSDSDETNSDEWLENWAEVSDEQGKSGVSHRSILLERVDRMNVSQKMNPKILEQLQTFLAKGLLSDDYDAAMDVVFGIISDKEFGNFKQGFIEFAKGLMKVEGGEVVGMGFLGFVDERYPPVDTLFSDLSSMLVSEDRIVRSTAALHLAMNFEVVSADVLNGVMDFNLSKEEYSSLVEEWRSVRDSCKLLHIHYFYEFLINVKGIEPTPPEMKVPVKKRIVLPPVD